MKKVNLKKLLRAAATQKQRRTIVFFLVKLGFSRISVSNKITKATRIVTMMTGNAYFTTPTPTLASISTLIDDLQAAESAMDGSKLNTEQRDIALVNLTEALKELQAYVELTAKGNTEMILSSGFEVRNPRTNSVIPSTPQGVIAENTPISGQVKLHWLPVHGNKTYMVQGRTDPATNEWELILTPTKTTAFVADLEPGQKYYFRVQASNSAGNGGWSDPAECRPN